MQTLINITKALADENRVRTLTLLQGGELCVCQIIEVLALAPSTVSKHLAILHDAGLVESRKAGRWMYYRLPGPSAPRLVQRALAWLQASLAQEKQVAQDARRLKSILKIEPRVLCCKQRDNACERTK